MYSKILIPTDGSELAGKAVGMASPWPKQSEPGLRSSQSHARIARSIVSLPPKQLWKTRPPSTKRA